MIILYGLEMIVAGALSVMLVKECIKNIMEWFEGKE